VLTGGRGRRVDLHEEGAEGMSAAAHAVRWIALSLCLVLHGHEEAGAQAPDDPIPGRIKPGLTVGIEEVARVPSAEPSGYAPIQYLHHAGDGSGRLFVADLRGQVWLIENGSLVPEPFLDLAAILGDRLRAGCNSCGVRSFAFHPDFDRPRRRGFGKVYTLTIQTPESSAAHPQTPVFRWKRSPVATVDVISEWQVDPVDPNRVDPASEREIMRVEQRKIGHSAEHIGFPLRVRRRNPDYGRLYVSIGDGGFDPDNPDPFREVRTRATSTARCSGSSR
jgi:hypothetical protein